MYYRSFRPSRLLLRLVPLVGCLMFWILVGEKLLEEASIPLERPLNSASDKDISATIPGFSDARSEGPFPQMSFGTNSPIRLNPPVTLTVDAGPFSFLG